MCFGGDSPSQPQNPAAYPWASLDDAYVGPGEKPGSPAGDGKNPDSARATMKPDPMASGSTAGTKATGTNYGSISL